MSARWTEGRWWSAVNTPDVARWSPGPNGTHCRMADCPDPPVLDRWCNEHLRRLANDDQWCPVKVLPGRAICGLCRTRVWWFRKLDDPQDRAFVLERAPHPDGRCWIVDGGFKVLSPGQAVTHIAEGKSLFRTHVANCAARAALLDQLH